MTIGILVTTDKYRDDIIGLTEASIMKKQWVTGAE